MDLNDDRPDVTCCPVLELRQYALHPGRRDVLIELFDREFVETQEALGMAVLGQFRDLDDPDRFVWFRGFQDMERRQEGLAAFYGGPVWAAHRDVANATMIDSDDVLLLRPVAPETSFRLDTARPPPGSVAPAASLLEVTVHSLQRPVTPDDLAFFRGPLETALGSAGGRCLALLETEPAENTFPALPVRAGEHVIVRVARFDDVDAHAAYEAQLATSAEWADVAAELATRGIKTIQRLRLQPTGRSQLR